MVRGLLFLLNLLCCGSPLLAVHRCDPRIAERMLEEPQAPVSYIDLFSDMNAWLVAASPDDEFGVTDTYYLDFNTSCSNTIIYYITQTFLDCSRRVVIHSAIKESYTEYYYEPGFDLYLVFFLCDEDLIVLYKCKPESCGLTLFLMLAPYGKTADQLDVAGCKEKVRNVYPQVTFKDMNYPRI